MSEVADQEPPRTPTKRSGQHPFARYNGRLQRFLKRLDSDFPPLPQDASEGGWEWLATLIQDQDQDQQDVEGEDDTREEFSPVGPSSDTEEEELVTPDDTPFRSIILQDPRPAFLTSLSARPKWKIRQEQLHDIAETALHTQARNQSRGHEVSAPEWIPMDSINTKLSEGNSLQASLSEEVHRQAQTISQTVSTQNVQLEQEVPVQVEEEVDRPQEELALMDHQPDSPEDATVQEGQTTESSKEGQVNTSSIDDSPIEQGPSTHANVKDAANPPGARAQKAAIRQKLQEQVRKQNQEIPFESEANLTDPSVSLSTDRQGSSKQSSNSANGHTADQNTQLQRQRTPDEDHDFTNMTMFTTPGDETVAPRDADEAAVAPPSTPRRRNDEAGTNTDPPRPSRKRVASRILPIRDRPSSPSGNADAPSRGASPSSDRSLTESQSDTDSESEVAARELQKRLAARPKTVSASTRPPRKISTIRVGGPSAAVSRPTLALSAALQEETAAAKRRRAEVPVENLDRLRAQEKRINARKGTKKGVDNEPNQGDDQGERTGKKRQNPDPLLLSSVGPSSRPIRLMPADQHERNATGTSAVNLDRPTTSTRAIQRSTSSTSVSISSTAPANVSSTSRAKSLTNTTTAKKARKTIPIKKPSWTDMTSCVASWTQWISEGRLENSKGKIGSDLFSNCTFLLVGSWDKSMIAWVERIVLRGGKIVPTIPHQDQESVTHIVSIGIPNPPNRLACEKMLGVSTLEDLTHNSETKMVTQEWVMQCIFKEQLVHEDDGKWKLV